MKKLQILSVALSVGVGIGLLMATILTGNKNTLPRTAVVIPTKNPISVRTASRTDTRRAVDKKLRNKLPTRLPEQKIAGNNSTDAAPDGIDRIITGSIKRKTTAKRARSIDDLIANNSDATNPFPIGDNTVVVQAGDTLLTISRRTGINVQRLAAFNAIKAPFVIRPGQILQLDGAR